MIADLNSTILFGNIRAYMFHKQSIAEIRALHEEVLQRAELFLNADLARSHLHDNLAHK